MPRLWRCRSLVLMVAGGVVAAAASVGASRTDVDVASPSAPSPPPPLLVPWIVDDEENVGSVGGDIEVWSWSRYYAHLMDPARTEAIAVLFTANACPVADAAAADDDDDGDGGTDDDIEDEAALSVHLGLSRMPPTHSPGTMTTTTCTERALGMATSSVARILRSRAFPTLRMLKVDPTRVPRAMETHRVPSWPALMFFPPRSQQFQRFAHPLTNFVDLSQSLSEGANTHTVDDTNGSEQPTDRHAKTGGVVVKSIVDFLRRSYAQNHLSIAGRHPPSESEEEEEASLAATILNAVPALALLAFIALHVHDHRHVLWGLAQSRFLWFLLTEFVLYVALSGLLHSLIHRVPMLYAHPAYGIAFHHPSGRKQFFLEGLVHGAWSFVISLAAFAMLEALPGLRTQYAREELFRIALITFGGAYIVLYLVFMGKHRWLV